jgi:hypothetical protein
VTWAYEWDFQLAPNGSYVISKDKNLFPFVPEPTSGCLLFIGFGLRVASRRNRRSN